MNRDRYSVSYGPPLAVKDRPHRELDTARGVCDVPDCLTGEDFVLIQEPVLVNEFEPIDAVEFVEASVEQVATLDAD